MWLGQMKGAEHVRALPTAWQEGRPFRPRGMAARHDHCTEVPQHYMHGHWARPTSVLLMACWLLRRASSRHPFGAVPSGSNPPPNKAFKALKPWPQGLHKYRASVLCMPPALDSVTKYTQGTLPSMCSPRTHYSTAPQPKGAPQRRLLSFVVASGIRRADIGGGIVRCRGVPGRCAARPPPWPSPQAGPRDLQLWAAPPAVLRRRVVGVPHLWEGSWEWQGCYDDAAVLRA